MERFEPPENTPKISVLALLMPFHSFYETQYLSVGTASRRRISPPCWRCWPRSVLTSGSVKQRSI